MKNLLPIIASGLIGIGAGFFLGRSSAPSAASTMAPPAADRPAAVAGGQESLAGAPSKELTPAQAAGAKLEPLTAAALRAEIAGMESGSFFGSSGMRKWADLQERLKVSDLAAIAADMVNSPITGSNGTGLHVVLSTFAEVDPQAAWNLAINVKQPGLRQSAVMAVVSALATKDPSRALALADSLNEPQLKRQVRSMAVSSLAQKDPARALALAMESPDARDGDYSFSMIFHQWARKDPEAAKAAVARLSGRQAEQARMALVSALAQQDPKKAWEFAKTLPAGGSNNYSDPRVQVIQSWSQAEPQAALQAAITIPESGPRSAAISAAVNSWAGSDFTAALKYAVAIEDAGTRGDIFQNLSHNPNASRRELLDAVLEHMPPGDKFQQAVGSVLSAWAREDPEAAARAAMDLPAGRAFSNVASQIASQWITSAKNKQDVFNWVNKLPEGEARRNSMQSIFSTWSAEDPQAAVRSLSTLTAEDRKQALRAVASGWSRTAPEVVLQWSASITDADERSEIIRTAVSSWAGNSPDAAAKYVERLGDSDRSGPMESLVNNWASRDTAAAAAWLDRQPAGASKDSSLRALSRKVAQEDPEAALTWVAGISDEKDRSRQTESIARDWIRQDPITAKAWISTSSLPEAMRTKLLK